MSYSSWWQIQRIEGGFCWREISTVIRVPLCLQLCLYAQALPSCTLASFKQALFTWWEHPSPGLVTILIARNFQMINKIFLKLLKRTSESWPVGTCILNRCQQPGSWKSINEEVWVMFLLLGQDLWSHPTKSQGQRKIILKSCEIFMERKLDKTRNIGYYGCYY